MWSISHSVHSFNWRTILTIRTAFISLCDELKCCDRSILAMKWQQCYTDERNSHTCTHGEHVLFFSLSLQSLKEGLTAEQRLHLFDNKDTKEFWQWRVTSAHLSACLETPLYFTLVMAYLVTLHTGHNRSYINKKNMVWSLNFMSRFCIPCASVTVFVFFVFVFAATSYCTYCF